jgi:DHA1 family tetracycline resistance protein-like MFS transporter
MNEPAPAAGRRAAVAFILVTIVIDVISFGIIIPVLPKLIVQFMGGDDASGAKIYGFFMTAWAAMQFICGPFLGALSDHYGRRRVILISCLGLGLDYIVMALAPTVGWLLLGRIISGITASNFSTAGAYIADVTEPAKRAQAFGMIGAAFGIGFVLGPWLGGELGGISPRLPFWVSAVMALINSAYGFFVLPESLKPENRAAFSWKRANPVGSLVLLRSHAQLLRLAAVSFLFQMAHYVLPSMFVLYASYRYDWSPQMVGRTLALSGISQVIVQAGLVKRAVRLFGERGALYAGLIFGSAGFCGFALAPTGYWLWAALPVFALMGLFQPGLQALMTARVGPDEQGKLQGANASMVGIAGLIGPIMFTHVFAYFIAADRAWKLPGAPFFVAAGLLGLGLLLSLGVKRNPLPAQVAADPAAAAGSTNIASP